MTLDQNSSNSDNSPAGEAGKLRQAKLDSLLERLCDQVIAPAELQELNHRLTGDPSARQSYLQYIRLHSLLPVAAVGVSESVGLPIRGGLPASCELLAASLPTAPYAGDAAGLRRGSRRIVASVAAAAAVLVVAAIMRRGPTVDRSRADGKTTGDRTLVALGSDSAAFTPVAHITFLSNNVEWRDENESVSLRSGVRAGQTLELTCGELRLAYESGVELRLMAPAEFILGANGGSLRRGGLRATVSERGRGFTIETPNGKIVDLGTEFGVAVDDFGVAEVSVFKGIVDAFPAATGDGVAKTIRLTEGQAVLWNRDALIHLDADPQRFESPRERSADRLGVQAGEPVVDEDLRGKELTLGLWNVFGHVASSPAGLVMTGDGTSANVPRLISTQEFDPSEGRVTVVCELRFAAIDPLAPPSFAVLTRSAALRDADAAEGWNTMHTCVRCRLRAQDAALTGAVEAATKMDRECPLTNIVWQGFHPLGSDVPYRLVMTDDGVNVTFSVSLASDPSIQKTVTCRSLFRGKQNFIALEGAAAGSVVVERIQAYQAIGRAGASERVAESAAAASGSPRSQIGTSSPGASVRERLDALAPRDARLVLSDDFDGDELDRQKWATLGDVAVVDGRLRLGAPNADEHINTWTARPYLLTRREFACAEGAVTVTGVVEFAANFLHEYGGSFAVMTRAVDRLGSGPGWEYSVLQSGVRANFWPAAWGQEHSLEIHEKPSPGALSLLVAQGLEINPLARTYLFRVVDDGDRVTLTLTDCMDSAITSVATARTTRALDRGIIGLESCWGCPVWLDDVRIYQSPR